RRHLAAAVGSGWGAVCCPMPAPLQLRQNFVWVAKGEIVEHHHDFLDVGGGLGGIADDERRRHQKLLLQAVMGMHPVGAGPIEWKVVGVAFSGWQRRLRQIGYAVLLPGWRQAVPMEESLLAGIVFQAHAKVTVGLRKKAV